MAGKNRDDFSVKDNRVLGERATYICSNPACRMPTIGPHSDPGRSLKTGKACHIKAASAGGPRYDATQSSEERSNIANGVWLCSVCSDRIDKDQNKYSAETLQEWKREHEEWIGSGGIVPKIPELSLQSLKGLTVPEVPGTLELGKLTDLCEHTLVIKNVSHADLFMIDARVELPEPVVSRILRYCPIGVNVGWTPIRMQMVASGSPGAKVERLGPPKPVSSYHLQIDYLPPNQNVQIGFETSLATRQFTTDLPFWTNRNGPLSILHWIDGSFQFEYQGAKLTKKFFAPINYDKESQDQSLIEVRDDRGDWQPVATDIFC